MFKFKDLKVVAGWLLLNKIEKGGRRVERRMVETKEKKDEKHKS